MGLKPVLIGCHVRHPSNVIQLDMAHTFVCIFVLAGFCADGLSLKTVNCLSCGLVKWIGVAFVTPHHSGVWFVHVQGVSEVTNRVHRE